MVDIRKELNDEQYQVATTTEGYLAVLAGAGSGKTRALTHRFVNLVKNDGVSPASILCITFTRKAADEMRKRIRSMLGDYDGSNICTFHGFCVKLLREDGTAINIRKNFMIHDELKRKYDVQLAIAETGHRIK